MEDTFVARLQCTECRREAGSVEVPVEKSTKVAIIVLTLQLSKAHFFTLKPLILDGSFCKVKPWIPYTFYHAACFTTLK